MFDFLTCNAARWMRRSGLCREFFATATLGLCLFSSVQAALKDQVLEFTGNARAKMVWTRTPAGNFENLYNTSDDGILVSYDTEEDAERILHNTAGCHMFPFITRSGDYAIWNDYENQKSMIIPWAGGQAKTLLSNQIYHVMGSHWDVGDQKEYIYALGNMESGDLYVQGDKIYRYELSGDAVVSGTQTLVLDLTVSSWNSASLEGELWARVMPGVVSGDGLYLAANQPWPQIYVNDLRDNSGFLVNLGSDEQSCWPQIAPDNSHRFFHLDQDHRSFHMFDIYTDPASSARWMRVADSLPGLYGELRDIAAPRWSNDVRFFATSYPLTRATPTAEFCIGKFNSGFTAVSAIKITNGQANNTRDKVGDLWLSTGEGPNKGGSGVIGQRARSSANPAISFAQTGSGLTVTFPGAAHVSAALINASGATAASYNGNGADAWVLSRNTIGAGMFVLHAVAGAQAFSTRILVR